MDKNKGLILIVEDFQDLREIYANILSENGFSVALASNGKEAVNKAIEVQPNLILMDLSMPVMDGWEATRRLKMSKHTKHIPVVLLTAHGAAGMPVVIKEGCAGFLIKPCTPEAIVAEIDRVLRTPGGELRRAC